jgi:hypothetical protein
MANTTNINELPSNPSNTNENISFVVNETSNLQNQNTMTLDQTTINQIVSGLQQASATGITQLASRDIPRSTENITRDSQIQANYIEPPLKKNYINNELNNSDEIIEKYIKTENSERVFESLYDNFQTPLLLSVLYFIFQLPIFRKFLFSYIPILFSKDGNINLNGLVFMSVMYGTCYYTIINIMTQLNTI